MKITTDNNYGADADGNRGHSVTEFELEYTTVEGLEIAEILFNLGVPSDQTGSVEIPYEGIDIDVKVSDYKSELEALEGEDDA